MKLIMSLHPITDKVSTYHKKIIHQICSLLFGVIFFGATTVGILTGLVLAACEEVASSNRNASRLWEFYPQVGCLLNIHGG